MTSAPRKSALFRRADGSPTLTSSFMRRGVMICGPSRARSAACRRGTHGVRLIVSKSASIPLKRAALLYR